MADKNESVCKMIARNAPGRTLNIADISACWQTRAYYFSFIKSCKAVIILIQHGISSCWLDARFDSVKHRQNHIAVMIPTIHNVWVRDGTTYWYDISIVAYSDFLKLRFHSEYTMRFKEQWKSDKMVFLHCCDIEGNCDICNNVQHCSCIWYTGTCPILYLVFCSRRLKG